MLLVLALLRLPVEELSSRLRPHDPARLSVAVPAEELGGKLEFAYRVGGGGGHSLSIEGAAVEVHGGAAVAVTQSWHDLPSVSSSKQSDEPQLSLVRDADGEEWEDWPSDAPDAPAVVQPPTPAERAAAAAQR